MVENTSSTDENPNNLPVLKFDEQGRVCNFDEVFNGIPYGTRDKGGNSCRRTKAWLFYAERVCQGIDSAQFYWGEVEIADCHSIDPYVTGDHYYYRIHRTPNSFFEAATKNRAASCRP